MQKWPQLRRLTMSNQAAVMPMAPTIAHPRPGKFCRQRSMVSFMAPALLLFFLCQLLLVSADQYYDDTAHLSTREILMRLHQDAGGTKWKVHQNWIDSSDHCTWYGVTCYGEDEIEKRKIGHVRQVELNSNHLIGVLPREIYQLPYISVLSFRDNPDLEVSFEGLAEAQHLEELVVSNTAVKTLQGLGAATSLLQLHMANLGLVSTFPEEITDLTNLKGVVANYNHFSGTLPTTIGRLMNLEEMFVIDSSLTGQIPSEIGQLRKLRTLLLGNNAFSGTLPESLNQCTRLATIAIEREKNDEKGVGVSGPLPAFESLYQLTELYLENQRLTGTVPIAFLQGAPRSESIKVDLTSNLLTGILPNSLSDLPRLGLFIADNRITGISDLCDNILGWMGGSVEMDGCEAFLCPQRTFAPQGRKTPSADCRPCSSATYFGSTECTAIAPAVSEQQILIEFYNEMGGFFWDNDGNWLNPYAAVCQWYGISCTDEGKVRGIDLSNNGLSGSPPESLFTLPELRELNLESNSIEFRFRGIGKAARLEMLDLAHTDLSSLAHIDELKYTGIGRLRISGNNLNTEIPTSLFSLVSLNDLLVDHNGFRGSVPSQVGLLSNLVTLQGTGNIWRGQLPSELGLLTAAAYLLLDENAFTGTLPTELEALTSAKVISLQQTTTSEGIGGKLLSFENLSSLRKLRLGGNRLNGTLPWNLLSNTQHSNEEIEISLNGNMLTGSIPNSWAPRFEQLYVDLSGNRITSIPNVACAKEDWMGGLVGKYSCDAILCPVGTYNELGRRIDDDTACRQCQSDGTGLLGATDCIGQDSNSELSTLRLLFAAMGGSSWFDSTGWITSSDYCADWFGIECTTDGHVSKIRLGDNRLVGSPPPSIFHLASLVELDLQDNQISFNFNDVISDTAVEVLYLSGTGLDSIEGIGKLANLRILHLTSNDIEAIPEDIAACSHLEELKLNFNRLSGRIPSFLSRLKNLVELNLVQNRLEGQIPGGVIGALTNLQTLSLTGNHFTGSLPPELNELSNIRIISIESTGRSDHAFSGIQGPLPSLNKLSKLRKLDLGSNAISGSIPFDFLSGIDDKSTTIEVDLISNQLTGELPASLTEFEALVLFVADNQISGIADGLCLQSNWMRGEVGEFECDAILCPPNTYSAFGRQFGGVSVCRNCTDASQAPFYGSFSCLSETDLQMSKERDILEAFFASTNGPDWEINEQWGNSDVSFCSWHGVSCISETQESVKRIRLMSNSLNGTIPSQIFSLPNLSELDLAANRIEFSFEGIENAEKLHDLNLDNIGMSSLRGISKAPDLRLLHASGNELQVIDDELYSLSKLEVLFLSDNSFSGEIPTQLQRLSNMIFFECANCGLEGKAPSWIASWPRLQYLRLSTNSLTGSLPASIMDCKDLKQLDLSSQNIRGDGLSGGLLDFSGLENLSVIHLARNRLEGTIPSTFLQNVSSTAKVVVDLRSNYLNGSIPTALLRLSDLDLWLAENQIDFIPQDICTSPWNGGSPLALGCDGVLCGPGSFNSLGRATDELSCSPCPTENYTEFFGSTSCDVNLDRQRVASLFIVLGGPEWNNNDGWLVDDDVCTWRGISCYDDGEQQGRIHSIALAGNNMQGSIPTEIYKIPYLKLLNVKNNKISLSFDGIQDALNLDTLYLSETHIDSLDGIGNAPSLRALHLTGSRINGPLPDELFGLASLEKLYLNFNELSSTLPSEIGRLKGLEELYLLNNQLSGSLPTELGLLTNLELLSIGNNMFTGELLSQTIASLKKLELLSVHNDVWDVGSGLSGALPSFSSLPKIRSLYLANNTFDGSIPPSFLNSVDDKTNLVTVDLIGNKLSGIVPSSLARFDNLRLFLAGNRIEGIPVPICQQQRWFNGQLGLTDCDAFLCKPGFFNEFGRQVGDRSPCVSCGYSGATPFYGSLTCDAGRANELDERTILFQLYAASGGNQWHVSDNWLDDDTAICNWHGVHCITINGAERVSDLVLAANGVSGTIPATIFHLKHLRVLNLTDSVVDVHFHSIGAASALEELYLEGTNIQSLDGIGQAGNLRVLNLEKNAFGGMGIPDELFDLTSLRRLYLSDSGFAGTLSTMIGNLVELRHFECHDNDISGEIPPTLGLLSNLKILNLAECDFYGTLPTTLNQLTSLEELYLDSLTRNTAGISGPLLSFSRMSNLRGLYMESNALTGEIPKDFLAGVDATDETIVVGLGACRLTGEVPRELSRLKRLDIDLTGNKILNVSDDLCAMELWMGGTVKDFGCHAILCPSETYNRKGRQTSERNPCFLCAGDDVSPYMGSTKCPVVDRLAEKSTMEHIFNKTGGVHWKNNDGWLQDDDICGWYGITCHEEGTVESIILGANNLVGSFPSQVYGLPRLRYLWLYSNPIQLSFDGIGRATELRSLLLDSTGLTSLHGLEDAASLVDVDVRFNALTGTLPELRDLRYLESFSCEQNHLDGTIPSFANNRKLTSLRVGGNQLIGTLPDFHTLTNLQALDVSDNLLTGSIPSLLPSADPKRSIVLDLSKNRLSGTVPGSLSRFDHLSIYLRDNRLTGISANLCDETFWNGGDVGSFQCDGIMCPPETYAFGVGRATQDNTCVPCDEAEFYGTSKCGDQKTSSVTRNSKWTTSASSLVSIFLIIVLNAVP